jgi:hypothetical protein
VAARRERNFHGRFLLLNVERKGDREGGREGEREREREESETVL